MEVEAAIRQRRSVRDYAGKKVGESLLERILEAGRWAPSGLNNQPWKLMILRGERKDSLAMHTKYGKTVKGADACIAVFLDPKKSYDREKDLQAIGACIQNMLLEAHAIGLGAVWLGEIKNRHEAVEKELGVDCELMAVLAIGWPAGKTGPGSRLSIEEIVVR